MVIKLGYRYLNRKWSTFKFKKIEGGRKWYLPHTLLTSGTLRTGKCDWLFGIYIKNKNNLFLLTQIKTVVSILFCCIDHI